MLRFDHIGYAVKSIQNYLEEFYVPLFEPASVGPIVTDLEQRVRVAFVTLDGGEQIELIEPLGEDSP